MVESERRSLAETNHPWQCVDQADLEKFDGVSPGKYTIGLGQTRMSFCDDREGTEVSCVLSQTFG